MFLLVFNGFIIYFSFTSPQALLTMIYLLTFGGFSMIGLVCSIMIKQVFDRIERGAH
ncbi:4-hydroxybenzoate polyprenyltransferase and related prenyltransferase [Lactococcus lactis subsp. lactis]|nr:4-hydroxybenzoate polyprenyltransferase and related prenyltransferase [Lactococcus lactis subsp. lactis]